ncbi:hypothetical protein [Anaeromicropila herbilytica]|uniref:Uncharacterized protein n=1 Tax=Anaeromicropila herbilytica TaxID=2785025 RepID=A0A7R7EIU9_9FIRM|nr:hypothetical protein [Anaeromicropila herbilytica]BCN29592.1 hypothetical protein bsdtb5_08870 [Anaeromicropila herbilytica]
MKEKIMVVNTELFEIIKALQVLEEQDKKHILQVIMKDTKRAK